MSDAAVDTRLGVEDIDDLEERTQSRHELVDGVAYAMVGASIDHARIVRNLSAALGRRLGSGPCEVFAETVRLHIGAERGTDLYYPDVMVCCDPTDNAERHRERPTVIAEIESRASKRIDRKEKLAAYSAIASVQEYLIVEQWRGLVEVHRRESAFAPEAVDFFGTLDLRSLGISIPVQEIYERVDFRQGD